MSLPNTKYGFESINEIMQKTDSIFFLGIGGVSMSSLAHMSAMLGFRVGGSDRSQNTLTRRLASEGIEIKYGHCAANIEGYGALVYTIAISDDNPEYNAAKGKGVPCISRADFMGYLMKHYGTRVGVSGMHGKSTCTSMIAHSLISADLDPTVLSGAVLAEMDGVYRIGSRDTMVFEACEYKDSFLSFYPKIAVILNIEMDHVDYFSSMEQIIESFASFIKRTDEDGGLAVINCDDEYVMQAAKDAGRNTVSFGLGDNADYTAKNITLCEGRYCFDIYKHGEYFSSVRLGVPGKHNVYNALACAAVCDICGADKDKVAKSFESFGGAKRRLEYKGCFRGADLFDDYAHHPTEVTASLTALREMGYKRVICAYQSHTYSRTAELFDDFAKALCLCDKLLLADIYAARETNIYGVTIEALANAVGNDSEAPGSFEAIADRLGELAQEGDAIVIMGAGDIDKIFSILK